MNTISNLWLRTKRSALDFIRNRSGVAAVEFAFIAPLMLVMLFGVVEVSDAIAVQRKTTLVARTLSDLTSRWQATVAPMNAMLDADLRNVFTASVGIVAPYKATPVKATITEILVNANGVAKVVWSKSATIASGATQATLATSSRAPGDTVTSTVPSQILVPQTYLIFAEVEYQYKSMVGKFIPFPGIKLGDKAYSRPRAFTCIVYGGLPAGNVCPLT